MSRRSAASALALALGLVLLVGLAGCKTRPKAETRGPFLSILQGQGTTAPRDAVPPGSIALALGGLPPEAMSRLRERLDESMDVAVRRVAPTLYDLDRVADDDAAPDPDPLRGALPDIPAVTAAANVLGAPWVAPGISVELVPTCPTAALRCVPLFAPATDPDDTLVRRGRALVWALGNAGLLRVPASSRAVLLRSLQDAQTRPAGTIALVYGAPRGTLDETELELLRQQARRVTGHLAPDTPRRSRIDALVATSADWALPIGLDPDEVLVIPRLSALARLRDFDSEIERAGTFEWVVRPGP